MPPENQNPTSLNNSLEFNPSEATGQVSVSAGSSPVVYPGVNETTKPSSRPRKLPAAALVLVVLLILATPFFVWSLISNDQEAQLAEEIGSIYPRTSIPLEDFIIGSGVDFNSQSVTINATLQANNGLVLSPMPEPTNPVAGQMYFDQTSNVLAYYDGTAFVPVVGGGGEITTTSIDGQTGNITLGPGLVMADGTMSNTGVTSLQGATGAVSLVPGTGMAIDGLTINNTGVTSLQGQSGSVTLTPGNGISISGTTISNSGVTDLLSGSPNVTVTDSGNGVKTISVSASSGGGNVTTGGGTVGTIPLFTSSENIEDSAITQSGMTVTITGDLSVSTGGLSLANALTVSNGGTGVTSLTANGVLIGNGTSPITAVSTATPNLCLLSTAGAPAWGACPGTSDVTSVNGQTGAVNIANASGAGGTVTIDDASTSAKGIASFNSTNFSVTSGAVNTIQDINATATPTFAGINTSVINPTGTLDVSGSLAVQGSNLTVGTGALQGGIDIYDANGNRASLVTAANLLTDITYTLPVPSGGATSADICLSTGNCAGAGAAITGSGTAGRLAVFDAAQNITDSSISESGSSINVLDTITDFSLQGGGLSVGSATIPGTVAIYSDNGNAVTINTAAALGGNYTYTLPDAGGNAEICLSSGNCIGGGGGGAPADAQYLVLATDANLTNERAISIGANLTSTDGGAGGNYTIATVQNPTFTTSVTTPTLQSSGSLNITSVTGLTITPGNGTATVDGDLNLTTGNQYQINGTQISSAALSNDANLAKLNQSQTFTGNNTFQNTVDSTNAFAVQNAAGDSIFAVDSTNSQIVLGTSQVSNGTIVFNDISSLNNVTLEPVNLAANRTIQLPDDDGVICLNTGNCAGAGATLQTAYNFSTGGTTPKIKVNDTLLGVDIQDADVSINDSLFTVRASNAAGLGQGMFDVQSGGQVTLQNATNSTTAFRVLTQGGTSILTTDTTNGRVILGQDGVSTGQIVFNHSTANTFTGSLVQGGLTANQTYTLPDESGTICLQSSSNCGFATSSGSGNYIQNTTTVQTSANIAVQGVGGSSATVVVQDAAVQSADLLQFQTNSGGIIAGVRPSGTIYSAPVTDPSTDVPANARLFVQPFSSGSTAIIARAAASAPATGDIIKLQDSTGASDLFTVSANGEVTNTVDSTGAFRVLNASSVPLFQVDTTNNRVYVGNPTADATGALLVLDTKNTTGDPTGVNGGMYYNSNSNKFRCFENSAWANCIGGGTEVVTFTSSGTFTRANYPGMKGIIVEGIGGGGGGGGAATTSATQAAVGGGGAGGGYFRCVLDEDEVFTNTTVTVGTGGAGGTAGANAGAEGDDTNYGGIAVVAQGGTGGSGANATSGASGPGTVYAGGTPVSFGTSSDCFFARGGAGGNGTRVDDGGIGQFGYGGSSYFRGPVRTNVSQSGANGINAIAGAFDYGAGGSGGYNYPSQATARSGGNGADGIVMITIFY